MKKVNLIQSLLTLMTTVVLCASLIGCVRTERVVTEEVTTSGKNWVETETTQAVKDRHGHVRIEKQSFYEKVKCVSKKDGHKIEANSPEECFKKGGKVVDKIITKESSEY
jgi:hypothetical protein